MRRFLNVLGCVSTMAWSTQVAATPPSGVVDILPVQRSEGPVVDLPEIAVRVNAPQVARITVQSVIESGARNVVDLAPAVNVTIAPDSKAAQALDLAAAVSVDRSDSVIVTKPGDVIRVRSPHLLGLQQGPHVQTITISMQGWSGQPSQQSKAYRFMDVQSDGIHWLSLREYDDLVSVKVLAPTPGGTQQLARVGQVGPRAPAPDDETSYEAVPIPAVDKATSDAAETPKAEGAQ